jgi:hypothetical protein
MSMKLQQNDVISLTRFFDFYEQIGATVGLNSVGPVSALTGAYVAPIPGRQSFPSAGFTGGVAPA